jgi:hypothetical protein
MAKKLFAVVGYTDWGKSNTLYELFGRRQFYPEKSPITSDYFEQKKFTVVNASNEQRSTRKYLDRLEDILKKQEKADTIFIITISLIFNDSSRDVKEVFRFLNSLEGFKVFYLILKNGWNPNSSLKAYDIARMENKVRRSKLVFFNAVINQSADSFSVRTQKIAEFIRMPLSGKKG